MKEAKVEAGADTNNEDQEEAQLEAAVKEAQKKWDETIMPYDEARAVYNRVPQHSIYEKEEAKNVFEKAENAFFDAYYKLEDAQFELAEFQPSILLGN